MPVRSVVTVSSVAALLWAGAAFGQKFPDGFFSAERVRRGEELSRKACVSCHLWPAPDILDRDTWWNGPLPWMMTVMGLSPEALPGGVEGELIRKSGGVLTQPAVSQEEFGCIIAYYLNAAPQKPLPAPAPAPVAELTQFRARPHPFRSVDPMALLVKTGRSRTNFFLGDGARGRLEVLTASGVASNGVELGAAAVSLQERPHGVYVAAIGSFPPSEQPRGAVFFLPRQGERFGPARPLLEKLPRPTHLEVADLNGDGREDLLVCQFGWYAGRLSWFENAGAERFVERELIAKPGAVRAEARDLNGDGRPDIAALFAQAGERMVFLFNDGRGAFTEKTIFQKHPSFGHSYFEFADFNGDGRPDLLTVNGDNGDYPSPPKPYHGLRIYLNEGGDRFEERFFLPWPGACKAVARDFDGDGDLDLAGISYYPDYRQSPPVSFLYLENRGGLNFQAGTFADSDAGRWLTLDAGDLDGDGDEDIVLGAARKGPGRDSYVPAELSRQWRESGVTVMVLENLRLRGAGAASGGAR
jgi:hypothetical protein